MSDVVLITTMAFELVGDEFLMHLVLNILDPIELMLIFRLYKFVILGSK